jgi:hypothetical protein
LGCLHGRGELGVRSRKQARDLVGQRLVGSESRELVLPQVEVAPGQAIELAPVALRGVALRGVVFRGHESSIAHHDDNASLACANRALSHCGIGAKVARLK